MSEPLRSAATPATARSPLRTAAPTLQLIWACLSADGAWIRSDESASVKPIHAIVQTSFMNFLALTCA